MLHLGKICLLQSAILHGKTGEADVLQAIHTGQMFTKLTFCLFLLNLFSSALTHQGMAIKDPVTQHDGLFIHGLISGVAIAAAK